MKLWDNITKEERIERWENVLRVLRGLSPHERKKHWDMATWGQQTECGTVACAAGHCGMDAWFRRRGLRNDIKTDVDWGGNPYTYLTLEAPDVEDFFGKRGCHKIFYRHAKRTVGTVILEVRRHLKYLRAQ